MERLEDNLTAIKHVCETNGTLPIMETMNAINNVVMGIFCFFSLLLNIYVVRLLLRGAESRISAEFFTLNLAMTDILYFIGSLLSIPINSSIQIICQQPLMKVVQFFFGFHVIGRTLFQTCICVERFLAVLYPVLFLKYKPLRYRLVCSGIIWLITMSSCVGLVFMTSENMAVLWLAVYVPFFGVMLFCCLAVLWGLCKPGPGEGERQGRGDNQAKMKAFRIISVIAILQLITITVTIFIYHAQFNFELLEHNITRLVNYLLLMSIFLTQPLLYLHRAGKLPCLTTL